MGIIGDFLRANSKAIAALVGGEVALLAAHFGLHLDTSLLDGQFIPLIASVIVWIAPKNKES